MDLLFQSDLTKRANNAILYHMSENVETRLADLERRIATQANLIDKLQNALIMAGRYENDDIATRVDGLQFLLKRAGEVKGREKGRRR